MMENIIDIRPMVIEDIEEFIKIRNEAKEYLHNNSEFSLSDAKKWFIENNPEFYIIEIEKKIVGYFRTSNNQKDKIYVGCDLAYDYRGIGIGYKSYVIFLEKMKKENPGKKIQLEVLSNNNRAINLYDKLGFVKIGVSDEIVIREGQQIESIIMELKLNNT